MPILVGSYFNCKIWKRKANSGQYEDTYTTFRAKITSDTQMSKNSAMQGIMTRSTSLVIETVDLEDVNIQDKIQILDNNYQVERVVTKKANSPYTLAAHKKTTANVIKRMPKVIYLV
jgi:Pyruvate/2-oxoacid:ferredoxin oxidoreductase gamma subunit